MIDALVRLRGAGASGDSDNCSRARMCPDVHARVRVRARRAVWGRRRPYVLCSGGPVDRAWAGRRLSDAERHSPPHVAGNSARTPTRGEGALGSQRRSSSWVVSIQFINIYAARRGLLQCSAHPFQWVGLGRERKGEERFGGRRAESHWVYVSTIAITALSKFPGGFPA